MDKPWFEGSMSKLGRAKVTSKGKARHQTFDFGHVAGLCWWQPKYSWARAQFRTNRPGFYFVFGMNYPEILFFNQKRDLMKINCKYVLLGLSAIFPALSLAQAYKCTINGGVVYQQQPCENGRRFELSQAPASPGPTSRKVPNPNSPLAKLAEIPAFKEFVDHLSKNERCKPYGVDESSRLRRIFELKLTSADHVMKSAEVPPEIKTKIPPMLEAARMFHPTPQEVSEYAYTSIPSNVDPDVLRRVCARLPKLLQNEIDGMEDALTSNRISNTVRSIPSGGSLR